MISSNTRGSHLSISSSLQTDALRKRKTPGLKRKMKFINTAILYNRSSGTHLGISKINLYRQLIQSVDWAERRSSALPQRWYVKNALAIHPTHQLARSTDASRTCRPTLSTGQPPADRSVCSPYDNNLHASFDDTGRSVVRRFPRTPEGATVRTSGAIVFNANGCATKT
jgi:hypothetical protein